MAYPLEKRALAVAEYRLTGCLRRAAREAGVRDHMRVKAWAAAADSAKSDHEKRLAARAGEFEEKRRGTLDALFDRAMELQLRDLPEADFRDRTGLLKIVNEARLLAKGSPTAINEVRSHDQMDREIEQLMGEMAERARASSS